MITSFIAMAVITALCLSFESTRWLGILAVTLLFSAYPFAVFALLLLAGATYYCYLNYLQ